MEAVLTEISREEALRYLGVRGRPDAVLQADLDRCAELLMAQARPRAVWKLFLREADGTLEGTAFRPAGQDIQRFLSGCGRVILMGATLGAEAETLLRRAQARAMGDALLLDALASAAVENVCDNLCRDLAVHFSPDRLTSRFSPGYGDFPLSQQRELCAVLDLSRRLGVSLTPGGLMIPQKSVTALIGVRGGETAPENLPGSARRESAEDLSEGAAEKDREICPESAAGCSGTGCSACGLSDHCQFKKEDQSCGR